MANKKNEEKHGSLLNSDEIIGELGGQQKPFIENGSIIYKKLQISLHFLQIYSSNLQISFIVANFGSLASNKWLNLANMRKKVANKDGSCK